MSKVLSCDSTVECKPWRVPGIRDKTTNNYDFKTSDPGRSADADNQDKIRQQSYEKSFAKGYMEGLAKGEQEINEQVVKLHSLLAALSVPLPELDDQVVEEMAQLCMAVARQMIRRELKTSPDEIVAVVREVLNILPNTSTDIQLELHPDDVRIINTALVNTGDHPNWTIVEDPLLTRGGCRVVTGKSRIDATVEKRINTIIAELMGGARKADNSK